MRPASATRALAFAVTIFMVACQGSDLTSPDRGIDLARKGGTGANPGPNALAVLSGGFVSTARPGVLRVSGSTASFETPFGAPIPIALSVDTNGGAVGPNQIPLQQQVFWPDCVWNTDVGRFVAPPAIQDPVGLQQAKDFWNLVLTTYRAQRLRHIFVYVDLGANGRTSWEHQALTRWFTWNGADKYMWEIEAGGESNLSLIQPVGSWNGGSLTITRGVIRLTRTYCGRDPKPEGCKPSRGKGARPTVVCRNDDTAFPGVEFVTTIQ
jgi:hypothetical protein